MNRYVSKPAGVALILVLMITGLLSLLMLQISLTAKSHVDRSQRLLDRAAANLLVHSGESELMFALLTQPWTTAAAGGETPFPANWNFNGVSFELSGTRYRVQDLAGLLAVPSLTDDLGEFSRLLDTIGASREQAVLVEREVARVLGKAQLGGNAGGVPIQSIRQLELDGILTPDQIARLESLTNVFPVPLFNPNTAPREVLAARFPGLTGDSVTMARDEGALDESVWERITGLRDNDFTSFFPGPGFRLSIESTRGAATARRETVVVLSPSEFTPFEIRSRRSTLSTELEATP
jgi:general secretion pathway protein K